MSEPDITLSVIKRARDLLRKRGWRYTFSSGKNSSLNIRSAISAACRELAPSDRAWYEAYKQATAELSAFLKDGIQSWEFGTHASSPRLRQEHEVFELFDKVIVRLESREKTSRAHVSRGSSSRTL